VPKRTGQYSEFVSKSAAGKMIEIKAFLLRSIQENHLAVFSL